MEEWKSVTYCDGFSVSSAGRVRRNKDGVILKQHQEPSGYWSVDLPIKSSWKRKRVHKVVTEAFWGACPEGQCVNHKDGDKSNNAVGNLEYCTYTHNNNHAIKMGLRVPARGENVGLARLKDEQVLEIYRLAHKPETTNPEVGKLFGISAAEVSLIKVGLRWQHLTGHRRSA